MLPFQNHETINTISTTIKTAAPHIPLLLLPLLLLHVLVLVISSFSPHLSSPPPPSPHITMFYENYILYITTPRYIYKLKIKLLCLVYKFLALIPNIKTQEWDVYALYLPLSSKREGYWRQVSTRLTSLGMSSSAWDCRIARYFWFGK